MHAFEKIVTQLFEEKGYYWIKNSVKINLTKPEKAATGKCNIPRPEIDLVAFNYKENEIILVEIKSYIDSPGVRIADLKNKSEKTKGAYKLLTSNKYRSIIEKRLREDWIKIGLINEETAIKYALVAGNVHQNKEKEIENFLKSEHWLFWGPSKIAAGIKSLAKKGYEDDPVVMAVKILEKK